MHAVWLMFLLRVLEVRKHGGDAREACSFRSASEAVHFKSRPNTDPPEEDEDQDVKEERARVKAIMAAETHGDKVRSLVSFLSFSFFLFNFLFSLFFFLSFLHFHF